MHRAVAQPRKGFPPQRRRRRGTQNAPAHIPSAPPPLAPPLRAPPPPQTAPPRARPTERSTRRVQLVRRVGRDVSTLYGREGGTCERCAASARRGTSSTWGARPRPAPYRRRAPRGPPERRLGALRGSPSGARRTARTAARHARTRGALRAAGGRPLRSARRAARARGPRLVGLARGETSMRLANVAGGAHSVQVGVLSAAAVSSISRLSSLAGGAAPWPERRAAHSNAAGAR